MHVRNVLLFIHMKQVVTAVVAQAWFANRPEQACATYVTSCSESATGVHTPWQIMWLSIRRLAVYLLHVSWTWNISWLMVRMVKPSSNGTAVSLAPRTRDSISAIVLCCSTCLARFCACAAVRLLALLTYVEKLRRYVTASFFLVVILQHKCW